MTQEFKTLEEIKEGVAKEHVYPSWETVPSERHNGTIENLMNEVAQRYSQQLQSLAESMQNLNKHLLEVQIQLRKDNKELVEMLEELLKELRYHGFNHSTAICNAESLITKHKQS